MGRGSTSLGQGKKGPKRTDLFLYGVSMLCIGWLDNIFPDFEILVFGYDLNEFTSFCMA